MLIQHASPLVSDRNPVETQREAADARPRCSTHDHRIRDIVSRECAFVCKTLQRFGVPQSLADDAAQMVFLTFSARIAEVQQQSERAFLTGTCLRIAANLRRGLARKRELFGVRVELPSLHDPERLLHMKRRRLAFDAALAGLPDAQREVYELFELEGFSLPEIASNLRIPIGTATSRLRRARRRMTAWTKRAE